MFHHSINECYIISDKNKFEYKLNQQELSHIELLSLFIHYQYYDRILILFLVIII